MNNIYLKIDESIFEGVYKYIYDISYKKTIDQYRYYIENFIKFINMKDEHLDITNDLNSRLMTKLNNDKQVITYSDLSYLPNFLFYILKIEATNKIIKNIKIRSQNSEEKISINKIPDLEVYGKDQKPINIKEYIKSELNAGSVIKSIEIICPSLFDKGIKSPLPPEPEEFIFPVKTVLIIVAVMVTLGLGYKYIIKPKNIKNTNIIMKNNK